MLWQAQHLTHPELVFVYAAAPADTPNPPSSLNKADLSVCTRVARQGWNKSMHSLPQASVGPLRGGSTEHAYIWIDISVTINYRDLTGFNTYVACAPQTKTHMFT